MEENAQKFLVCNKAYLRNVKWAIWDLLALLICFYFYATGDYPIMWAIFALLYGASLPYTIWRAVNYRRARGYYYKLVYDEILSGMRSTNDVRKMLDDIRKENDL